MQFNIAQALTALALTSSVLAKPMPVLETGLQVRQAQVELAEITVEDIIAAAEAAVNLIKGLVQLSHQHDAENQFTQSTVQNLNSQYPNMNVMIYHDTDSKFNFPNGQHTHYELDIGLGFTEGYEIWVFEQGTFDKVGDGGYINWCFSGNFNRNGNHVDFFPINTAAPAKRSFSSAITYDFNSRPGANHTHTPLHAPVTYTPPPSTGAILPPLAPTSDKNGDDGNYFVECKSTNGTAALGLAYYKELKPHGGNTNQQPDDFELLVETGSKGSSNSTISSHDAWRFPIGAIEFEQTKSTVHWSLFGQAQADNVSCDQTAGFADNGVEHFWIYKDDGEQLFTKDQWTCNSLYYAY